MIEIGRENEDHLIALFKVHLLNKTGTYRCNSNQRPMKFEQIEHSCTLFSYKSIHTDLKFWRLYAYFNRM